MLRQPNNDREIEIYRYIGRCLDEGSRAASKRSYLKGSYS